MKKGGVILLSYSKKQEVTGMDSPDGNSRSTKYGVSSEKEYRWLRMSDLRQFLDHGKFREISCYLSC